MKVKIRCPYCNAQGINKLAAEKLGTQAFIVYCGQCGAIHGIVPAGNTSAPAGKSITPAIKQSSPPPMPTLKTPNAVQIPGRKVKEVPAPPPPTPLVRPKPKPASSEIKHNQLEAMFAASNQPGMMYRIFNNLDEEDTQAD